MLEQRTLKTLTRAVGVGLHSGQRVELTLRPAPADTGIVFRRVDLPDPVDIAVNAQAITDTRLASTIGTGNAKVHTIEHLMSACAGLGIDNLYVDITAEEVPILDGSASSFVFLLQSAGVVTQKAPKKFIRVLKPVEVREGEGAQAKWARLEPYHGFSLSFEIDFRHPAVDSTGQMVKFDFTDGVYARDIARARTFGFTKDVEMLRQAQCVGCVLSWCAGQLQQAFDHFLNLRLGGASMARDRLLHLQCGVFSHRQLARHKCSDAAATCLAQHQAGLRVDVDEHNLYRGHIGLVTCVDFANAVVNDLQSGRQVAHFALGGFDHSAGDIAELLSLHVDHPKACGLQPGVNAQYADDLVGGSHGMRTSAMRAVMVKARSFK